jgi:hypothetical protein
MSLTQDKDDLERELMHRFDLETQKFIDYWFCPQTQLELLALVREIEKVKQLDIRSFLELVFSAIIITKTGGVSLAWDLAHTRPHRLNQGIAKSYKPAIYEFKKRLLKNITEAKKIEFNTRKAIISFGNAQSMPLQDCTIDLLFTSPPYASNAIDYMRAHKFSLIWLGKSITELSGLRPYYIGGEKINGFQFLELPTQTQEIISQISHVDGKKGLALHRYYTEMRRVLSQAYRVLKPSKAAVFVIASSTIRGIDTQAQNCIAEIGANLGFDVVGIAARQLHRDRRMMPIGSGDKRRSQIEERMHIEHIVALMKPSKDG